MVPDRSTAETQLEQLLARVERDPTNLEASFLLSAAAADAGDFVLAIGALERIFLADPTLRNIQLELGVLYLQTGATALAERYIAEAIADPTAPPEVVARAREFQMLAASLNDPDRLVFRMSAGLSYNSNPEGVEDDPEGDWLTTIGLSAEYERDLGYQAGHTALATVSLSDQRYFNTPSENFLALNGSVGIVFRPGYNTEVDGELRLSFDFSREWEQDVAYRSTRGISIDGTAVLSPRWTGGFRLSASDEHYDAQDDAPANADRSGARRNLSADLTYRLAETAQLTFGLTLTDKSAEVAYETYEEAGLSLAYRRVIEPLGGWSVAPITLTATASFSQRDYEDVNPVLWAAFLQDDPEEVTRQSFGLEARIPTTGDLTLVPSIQFSNSGSNVQGQSSDSVSIGLTVQRRF